MKLSKAQQKIIDESKERIDIARSYGTFEEYFNSYESKYYNNNYNTAEKLKKRNPKLFEGCKEWWENNIRGIVLVSANSRTLYRLVELGLIEIIYDAKNEIYGCDTIKLLNY